MFALTQIWDGRMSVLSVHEGTISAVAALEAKVDSLRGYTAEVVENSPHFLHVKAQCFMTHDMLPYEFIVTRVVNGNTGRNAG